MLSFTDRNGGTSTGVFASRNLGTHVGDDLDTVILNRKELVVQHGPIQYMDQVHGDRIAIIEEATDVLPRADALVTGIHGITLAVLTADCIPLLLISDEVVAAVHVGRRGLVNGITDKTLKLMTEMGATKIRAAMGPAICALCYEVSKDIFHEVTALHPLAASKTRELTLALDLPAALTEVLRRSDVELTSYFQCTYESLEHFSYRRDGVTGRQGGLVSL